MALNKKNRAKKKKAAKDPTIQAALKQFADAFKACHNGDMIDNTRNDMLEFLQSKNLPAYFQVKSHIILSVAEEQNPAEAKSHLFKDIEALEVAKQTETHNRAGAGELERLGPVIRVESAALRARENVPKRR